jgi:acyl transferase domain-containing protein
VPCPKSHELFQVIVDSSLQYLQPTRTAVARVNGIKAVSSPKLLLFSANSVASLDRRIESFREYATQHPDSDADLAYTLAFRRENLAHRAFAVVQNGILLETCPAIRAPASASSITMVFSGQGAQWSGMGRELILTSPAFRRDIIHMDKVLQSLQIPPGWFILGMFNPTARVLGHGY